MDYMLKQLVDKIQRVMEMQRRSFISVSVLSGKTFFFFFNNPSKSWLWVQWFTGVSFRTLGPREKDFFIFNVLTNLI